MSNSYDFSGWATKNDIRCSDGRIIRQNAFAECDGLKVPLVWNHQHDSPSNVLGHALLENRAEGVYAYGSFNDTEDGLRAKEMVKHGDVSALSIYANKLKQHGGDVIHGSIREVSLVLAGANPGAFIDSIMIHGEFSEDEAYIYNNDEDSIRLYHKEEEDDEEDMTDNEKTIGDIYESMNDEQKSAVYAIVQQALYDQEKEMKHSEETEEVVEDSSDDETVEDIFNTFNEDQQAAAYALIGMAMVDADDDMTKEIANDYNQYMKHSDEMNISDAVNSLTPKQRTALNIIVGQALEIAKEVNSQLPDDAGEDNDYDESEGGSTMSHNLFESMNEEEYDVLSHSDMEDIFDDALNGNVSLKDSFLAHGIDNIEYLFPDATNLDKEPRFIRENTSWVSKVMNNVHHTPFARIKSVFADITEPEARAKGYVKGNRKFEEFISILKRITLPTTIYKKQKLDRDDIVDISDFDSVAWLKTEMRGKLDEEIARAILVSDGRSVTSPDKINEQNIRPIWTDDDLFTIKEAVAVPTNATPDQRAKAWIRAAVKARKNYKGTGNPTMFTTEDMLSDALLAEDGIGRRLYNTEAELASALRVKEIVTVPDMEGLNRIVNNTTHYLIGIIVNLADYNVGADKGGAVNMFDDFDIDYNAQKYLIETRISGALTLPYSAIALELVYSTYMEVGPEDPTVEVLGKYVDELQEGVAVNDTFISGKLKHVTGYTGYSSDPALQSGNFLAIKVNATEGSVVTVELLGGNSGPVELDSDMNAVIRIANKNTQRLKVVMTNNGETTSKIYTLKSLICLAD